MISVISIKSALNAKKLNTRTLSNISVDTHTIAAGNNAVSARCTIGGREGDWLIKCYFRNKPHLSEIYGDAYYPKELNVRSINGDSNYIDVVIMPWAPGQPLDWYIGRPGIDYAQLSREFDILALKTLDAPYAHGDVKPENIIVDSDYKMTLIDFDAMWRPELSITRPTEIGTLAYRSPNRDASDFNKYIDDYSFALISTALAALALDREAMEKHIKPDKSIFTPKNCIIKRDVALDEAKRILLEHNDVAHYRIAMGLETTCIAIYRLRDLFYHALHPFKLAVVEGAEITPFDYLWGYVKDNEWIIPPLFDSCDPLREGHGCCVIGNKRIELPIVSKIEPNIIDSPIAKAPVYSTTWYEDRLAIRPKKRIDNRYAKYGNSNNQGKLWSFEEEMLMAMYLFDGYRLSAIARKLARSEKAVVARIHKLKLPITKRNRRK